MCVQGRCVWGEMRGVPQQNEGTGEGKVRGGGVVDREDVDGGNNN